MKALKKIKLRFYHTTELFDMLFDILCPHFEKWTQIETLDISVYPNNHFSRKIMATIFYALVKLNLKEFRLAFPFYGQNLSDEFDIFKCSIIYYKPDCIYKFE